MSDGRRESDQPFYQSIRFEIHRNKHAKFQEIACFILYQLLHKEEMINAKPEIPPSQEIRRADT